MVSIGEVYRHGIHLTFRPCPTPAPRGDGLRGHPLRRVTRLTSPRPDPHHLQFGAATTTAIDIAALCIPLPPSRRTECGPYLSGLVERHGMRPADTHVVGQVGRPLQAGDAGFRCGSAIPRAGRTTCSAASLRPPQRAFQPRPPPSAHSPATRPPRPEQTRSDGPCPSAMTVRRVGNTPDSARVASQGCSGASRVRMESHP